MPAEISRGHLLRILGVAFGVAVALGNTIGAGILRSPSTIAGSVQSVGIILVLWLAGAVHAALDANIFVELGTAMPEVGGPYVYSRRALGDVAGLIVGWSIWCAKLAGIAAGAVSFANFFVILVPAAEPRQAGIAVAIQLVLYGANILGLREGRVLQEATSFLKASALLAFAIAAVFAVPAQAAALLPSPHVAVTWVGITVAYKLIRGAYSGWDAPLYFLEESHAPTKTLPRALFLGLLLTSSLYLIVNASLLYALGPQRIAATTLPFLPVLRAAAGPFASLLFAVGAMITVLSMANANIMSAPRILFALSRDRLLPHQLELREFGRQPTARHHHDGAGLHRARGNGKFRPRVRPHWHARYGRGPSRHRRVLRAEAQRARSSAPVPRARLSRIAADCPCDRSFSARDLQRCRPGRLHRGAGAERGLRPVRLDRQTRPSGQERPQ